MDTQPTQDELQGWWDGLSEAAKASIVAKPDAAVDEEFVDEVMSYQNKITTFARWDRGLRIVHLTQAAQDFITTLP
jgi:hypothetical protein